MTACTPECWTPKPCPDHPAHMMPPRGRSVATEDWYCCERRMESVNPRHLWDEHDDERWRFDPEGEREHLKTCAQCHARNCPAEEQDEACYWPIHTKEPR
jgi:hypothetical protein